jgi:hypothetical protein
MSTTILEQLGGNRFVAMTGANTFVGDEQARSLRFKISSRLATNGANLVRVTLEPTISTASIFQALHVPRPAAAPRDLRA